MKNIHLDKIIRDCLCLIKRHEQKTYTPGICLSEEEISDYLYSSLSHSEKQRAEGHFIHCQNCRNILTTLVKVDKLEKSKTGYAVAQACQAKTTGNRISSGAPTVGDALRVALAWIMGNLVLEETNSESHLPSLLQSSMRPWPLPLRGETEQPPEALPLFSKTVSDFTIVITIKKGGGNSCELLCNITSIDPEKRGGKAKLELFQDDRLISSYPLIKEMISFSDITPGNYTVVLQEGEARITIVSLSIRDDKNR